MIGVLIVILVMVIGTSGIVQNKAYISNKVATNLNNRQYYWEWSGIPVVQSIININKDYKYMPAKYLSFYQL